MDEERPEKKTDVKNSGFMGNVWHFVAAAYAGALIYAQVWQQLEVHWTLWLVVAVIGEPGSFSKLAIAHGADFIKWLRR